MKRHLKGQLGLTRATTKEDIQCLLLAKLGISVKAIAQQTRLTPSQVVYRCSMAGLKLRDYRDGTSEFAQRVIVQAEVSAHDYYLALKGELKQLLEKRDENKRTTK